MLLPELNELQLLFIESSPELQQLYAPRVCVYVCESV
jgi:hypothetical protein